MDDNMNFFKDDDLEDLLKEMEESQEGMDDDQSDEEMNASQRRYQEIIKKHKN